MISSAVLLLLVSGIVIAEPTEECKRQMLPEVQFLSNLMIWSDVIYFNTPNGTLSVQQQTKCFECTHLRGAVYVVNPTRNLTTVDSYCLFPEDITADTPTVIIYLAIFEAMRCRMPFRYQFLDPSGDWKKHNYAEPIRMIIPFEMINWADQ